MTCVVGFSDGNTIIFGADSAAAGGGPETSAAGEIYTPAEPKVFPCGAYLLGVCGSYRVAQVLRHRAELPEMPAATEDLERFLVRDLLPALAATIEAAAIAGTRPGYLGDQVAILLGIRGRLWTVCSDLTLLPESGFGALGSGRHRAYGALYALDAAGVEGPRRRLEIALEAAAAYTSDVRPPWHFVSSEDKAIQWPTATAPASGASASFFPGRSRSQADELRRAV
jgi:hypothetical protein